MLLTLVCYSSLKRIFSRSLKCPCALLKSWNLTWLLKLLAGDICTSAKYLSILRICFSFCGFIMISAAPLATGLLTMWGKNCLELPDLVKVSACERRSSSIRRFCTLSFSWTLLTDRTGFLRFVLLYLLLAACSWASLGGRMLTVLSSSIVIFC